MNPSSPDHIDEKITRLCIEEMGEYVNMTCILSPVHAGILVYIVWHSLNQTWLMMWLGVLTLNSGILYLYYRQFRQGAISIPNFLRYSYVLAALEGLSWGNIAFIAPPNMESADFTHIFITLISMNIVPQLGLSQIPVLHRIFISCSLCPLILSPLYYGTSADVFWIMFSTLWVIIFYLSYGQVHATSTHKGFAYQIENEILSEKLKREKEAVERTSAAKTKFLAAASHDLRQPLQAQHFFVSALQHADNDEKRDQLIENLAQSTQVLGKLLNSLLDISKLDAHVVPVNQTAFSLASLFQRLEQEFKPLTQEKNLRLNIRPTRLWTFSDETLLENIIRNLLSNALRYTHKGHILVACTIINDKHCVIDIRDTGIGIAVDKIPFIFDEFYQINNDERNRNQGLGLGLSIVKRTTDLLGHRLSIDSDRHKGTAFKLVIPLIPAEHHAIHTFQPQLNLLQNKTLLIIDDDPLILDSLGQLLDQWGCYVIAAVSGQEAVDKTQHLIPDIIISDYRLAANERGDQVIHRLLDTKKIAIPALLLTGETAAEELIELNKTHFRVLHKPVQPAKLRAILIALLSS